MNRAEEVLLSHLGDAESLTTLSAEGFGQAASLAVIPTQLVRKITGWAIAYYWDNGRKVGPSEEAILAEWGNQLEELEITLPDRTEETDSIEWAIRNLRAQYATSQTNQLVRKIAVAVNKADPTEKVSAVIEAGREFHLLAQALSSRRAESLTGLGLTDAALRHEDTRANGVTMHGMALGIDLIDRHTLGIHPGEIAIFGASTGVGKSWVAAKAMLAEWQRGRRAVLVTLENDLEMTFDRVACLGARVPYDRWQRGQATDEEVSRLLELIERMEASEHQPVVTMLQPGERDPLSIVRRCHTLGGESLIVDQLSYVEPVPGRKLRERHQEVSTILREFQVHLRDDSSGRLPALIMAQISREGRVNAEKRGEHIVNDFGLTTEIENIASHLWAAMQSPDQREVEQATLQTLKFRRGVPLTWDMRWRLGVGDIRALGVQQKEDA